MKLNKLAFVIIVLGIIAGITVVYQLTKEDIIENTSSITQPIIYLSSVEIIGGFYKGYQGEAIEIHGTSYYVCIRLENGFLYRWIDKEDLKIVGGN